MSLNLIQKFKKKSFKFFSNILDEQFEFREKQMSS